MKFEFSPLLKGDLQIDDTPSGKTAQAVGTAKMVAGTVDVADASIDANSIVFLTGQGLGGTLGELSATSITPGVGFTITSSSNLDTRTVAWAVFEVTPPASAGLWLSLGLALMP